MPTKVSQRLSLIPNPGFVQLEKLMKPVKTHDMKKRGRMAFINFPLC